MSKKTIRACVSRTISSDISLSVCDGSVVIEKLGGWITVDVEQLPALIEGLQSAASELSVESKAPPEITGLFR